MVCTHKLNCRTSRFLRLVAVACSLSGVGSRSCRWLEVAESWDELWYLKTRATAQSVNRKYAETCMMAG